MPSDSVTLGSRKEGKQLAQRLLCLWLVLDLDGHESRRFHAFRLPRDRNCAVRAKCLRDQLTQSLLCISAGFRARDAIALDMAARI